MSVMASCGAYADIYPPCVCVPPPIPMQRDPLFPVAAADAVAKPLFPVAAAVSLAKAVAWFLLVVSIAYLAWVALGTSSAALAVAGHHPAPAAERPVLAWGEEHVHALRDVLLALGARASSRHSSLT
jgi:hypothetical protein